jgi:Na+/H+-dicarboxylate symporter
MIIVPLILSSITMAVTSIHDPKKLGRVSFKTIAIYILTTLAAITIGLVFAKIFQPGTNMNLHATSEVPIPTSPSFGDLLLSLVPTNPFTAFVEGNILQIIVFSLFFGIAINFAGERGKPLLEFFESLSDVMNRMTSIIMEFSPIGVYAIMAWASGTFGTASLLPLIKFLSVYYAACLFHIVIVFGGILWFITKLSPWPFFKGMADAIMIAFTTCSSRAALPVSMHCVQKNLGVSKNITNFVIPLGCSMNMNGAALFQGMSTVFLAQAYGIPLGWHNILTVVIAATLSSLATTGIPGSSFLMLPLVFSSIGLPLEGLALLAGVDRLRDMMSTVLNVLGDVTAAVYVAESEGELNKRQYYHADL